MSDGQVKIAFSPIFIRPTPSVQHLMTPLSGKVAGCPRLRELSNTVPSTSFPSYCTVTRSVGVGEAPVPGEVLRKTKPDGVWTAPDSRAAFSRKALALSLIHISEPT